jgi:hypothetical protein
LIYRFIRTQAVHERLNHSNNKKNNKNKDSLRFQDIIDKQTTNKSISTVNLILARSLTAKEQQAVEKDGKLISLTIIEIKLLL